MLGPVDLGRAQVADQQLVAAKHIQRQETVVVVIAVEKPALLVAVHRVVGGVEVEDQLLGRCSMGRDKPLQKNLVYRPRPIPRRRVLEPAQRRRTGQGPVPPSRRLKRNVMAQGPMVVDILETQRQTVNPLAQQGGKVMDHLAPLAPVAKPPRHRLGQAKDTIRLAQQQNPAATGNLATRKRSLNPPPTTGWKLKNRRDTIRHRCLLPSDPI